MGRAARVGRRGSDRGCQDLKKRNGDLGSARNGVKDHEEEKANKRREPRKRTLGVTREEEETIQERGHLRQEEHGQCSRLKPAQGEKRRSKWGGD